MFIELSLGALAKGQGTDKLLRCYLRQGGKEQEGLRGNDRPCFDFSEMVTSKW
jgi:hypothetical protein